VLEKELVEAINAQIGRELEAHLEYLQISAYFDDEALPQLSRFFRAQAQEEHDHAMRFLDYMLEAGGRLSIPAIHAPRDHFESAEEAVAASLEWERVVTGHIDDLMNLAIARSDHATQAMLQWFVTEQVEEVSTMEELLQVVRRAGETNLLLVEGHVARMGVGGDGSGG
jgi:bacterioferritin B